MPKLLSSLLLLSFACTARAELLGKSVFIEPYVGYKSESTKLVDLTGTINTQIKSADPAFGLKFGYRSLLGIDFNLAGNYVAGQAEVSGLPEKNKYSHSSASVELGINSFGLIKMYLGTTVFNELKLNESANLQETSLTGPAYSAGLQLKVFKFLNLGFQYNLNQYNSISGNAYANGNKIETYYSKIDNQDYCLFLSAPL